MALRPSTLFAKLFLGTTLLIVLVLCTCAWLIMKEVNRFSAEDLTDHLRTQASILRQAVGDRFDRVHAAELDHFVKQVASSEDHALRITLILTDGTVLAESEANPEKMESHAQREEVRRALAQGWGVDTRVSRTIGREMQYVAVRVGSAESPAGVVRVSMAVRTIVERREAIERLIWAITLLGLAAAVVFALGLAGLWSNPIRRIAATARSLSRGDLSARARVSGRDELAELARSLNGMRDHLAGQLATIDRQKRTLESLVAQLREGVVVAGPDGRVLLVNPAAVRLLGLSEDGACDPGSLVGRAVEQCVPQHELQGMLFRETDRSQGGAEVPDSAASPADVRQVRVQGRGDEGEMLLLARASDFLLPGPKDEEDTGAAGRHESLGRILVLTDITELDRTVRVKMDFASNASHELRTPLSAIKAAVETLMSINLAEDSESAARFLRVVERHTNRMEDMVSDLLDLSRIESSPTQFKPQPLNLLDFLRDLHARHAHRLEAKQLQWSTDVSTGLSMVQANPYLLRITLDNLVDNAIKFTEAKGHVSITCQRLESNGGKSGDVSITVSDTGCGIAEDERERVFERFYQVAKARSGPDRGTGLGLSIVRHAVAAMNGTVTLASQVGRATHVTTTIPQPG